MIRRVLRRCRRRLSRWLIRDAAYRFLVSDWNKVQDVNLAAQVLDTACFRDNLTPMPLALDADRYVLLAPHQDDEAIGAGGTLLEVGKRGAHVDVVYITDGGALTHPAEDRGVAIRRAEAARACAMIPADVHELAISNVEPRPTGEDVDRLAASLAELRPDVLLVPWLLDGPVKHRMTNHLLWLAARGAVPEYEIWGYQVHNMPPPNGYVDISAVIDQKRAMLECFESQNHRLMRYDHISVGLAAWNSRFIHGTGIGYAEVFVALPGQEYLALIGEHYFRDFGQTYRNAAGLRAHMEALHATRGGSR